MEEVLAMTPGMDISLQHARKSELSHDRIVNAVNYLHFQGKPMYVVFKHLRYNSIATVKAFPFPCYEDYVHLSWKDEGKIKERSAAYALQEILVDTGNRIFSLSPDGADMDENTIRFDIHKAVAKDVTVRKVERHTCHGVDVEMVQNGLSFRGRMNDFSAFAFSATMSLGNFASFRYVNPDIAITAFIKKGEELLYSGECRVIRCDDGITEKFFVLEPVSHHLYRFKPKTHRSPRHQLHPSPNIMFVHPFTDKIVWLRIEEMSGSGFSVTERVESATLLPGMILPKVSIEFAHGIRVDCRAQVMTRNLVSGTSWSASSSTVARCGIAILDMETSNQTLIASILHQATDRNSYVCNPVDMDKLWRFFFETGFIYPKKYRSVFQNMERFRETYRKLYLSSPDIARHFVYQERGEILGHISMMRFFENTWLFHHHASLGTRRAGLIVLDQIGRYVNDVYNMHSSHMQYVLCYFRPENRFPNRVFGGYARHLADPKLCSLDDFAHVLLRKSECSRPLPASMTLEPSTASDLFELEDYHSHAGGGLMLTAFALNPASPSDTPIKDIYEKNGMKRDRYLFSLKEGRNLKAVFMANISDFGLNMSNLTNCVTAFVLDGDNLDPDDFQTACYKTIQVYAEDEIPVLVYPVSYAEQVALKHDKVYRLWSFNTQHTDHYLDFVSRLAGREKGEPRGDHLKHDTV